MTSSPALLAILRSTENEPLGACVQRDTARGFNRLWRTELPQIPCAGAGSVVLLRAKRNIGSAELAALQAQPVGERTADGYGAFVITTETLEGLSLEQLGTPDPVAEPEDLSLAAAQLERAQHRLYSVRLRRLLTAQAVQDVDKATGLSSASASLFQRMRGPLRGADGWKDVYSVWFGNTTAAGSAAGNTAAQVAQTKTDGGRPLRRETRDALKSVHISGKRLDTLLQEIAAGEWSPTLRYGEKERESCRLLPEQQAGEIWEKEWNRLMVLYLDTLLGLLAKRVKKA